MSQIDSTSGHIYSAGDWQSLTTAPGAIRSTALAYSPDDLKILLYGGRTPTGTLVNEVWVYDIVTGFWTNRTDWNCIPLCPSARSVHSMVYDQSKKLFIVFGGYLFSGHSFETNETWTYDLSNNTWTKLDFGLQAIPEPRHWGPLEYNPDQNVTYMFGGHFNNANCPGDKMYNDVWRLDISGPIPIWTNMNATSDPTYGLPAPRQSDWIYNKLDKSLYVFGGKQDLGPSGTECGGKDIETFYNDIWKYDPAANQWTLIQPEKSDYTHYPKPRRTDIVYDDSTNSMMLFSGMKDSKYVYGPDTWLYDFDSSRWSTVQDSDGSLPPVRDTMAAAWDELNDIMYIYGVDDKTKAANFWKLKIIQSNISISCFDKQPVIFGTDNNDNTLLGNDAVNVIASLKGDDNIVGGQGNDFLCGGSGNDKISGDAGIDRLYGFDGNDEIHGGSGNDNIRGGNGNDKLYGEAGKDAFDCGSGTDTITDFNAAEGDSKASSCEFY